MESHCGSALHALRGKEIIYVSIWGKSRREAAGGAAPCTPAKGAETLWNPTVAAHYMRCGGKKLFTFLFGANPAGRRQGALPPAPPPKGLRPFGIPLMQRITCAAEGKKLFAFLPGANPAGRRRDLLFLVARLGADSCRGRRRVAHDARLGWGKGRDAKRYPSADTPHDSLAPCFPRLPCFLQSPVPTSKSRRRPAGFALGRNKSPSSPSAAHKMRRQSGILKGLRPLSRGIQGGQRPLGAAVRRDLPRVETKAHHPLPRRIKCAAKAGFSRVSDP